MIYKKEDGTFGDTHEGQIDEVENEILDFLDEHEEEISEECYQEVEEQTTFCVESGDDGSWVAVEDCWVDEEDIKNLCIEYFKENFKENPTKEEIEFFLDNLDIPSFNDMIERAKEEYCEGD